MFFLTRRILEDGTLYEKIQRAVILFSLLPIIVMLVILLPTLFVQKKIEMERDASNYLNKSFNDLVHDLSTLELVARSIASDSAFFAEVSRAVTDRNVNEYEKIQFRSQTLSSLKIIMSISGVQAARLHIEYPELREYSPYLYRMDRAENSLWYGEKDSLDVGGKWFFDVTDKQAQKIYSGYVIGDDMASFVIPFKITTELKGVFEVMLPIDRLVPQIYGESGNVDAMLMDANGGLYGVDRVENASITLQKIEEIIGTDRIEGYNSGGVEIFYTWINGKLEMLSLIRHSGNGIYLISITPVMRQYAFVIMEMLVILGSFYLIIRILLWVINLIVKRMLNDLNVFVDHVKKVADGNLDVRIPQLKQMESSIIAEEYNKMLDNLQKMTNESIQRGVILRDVQIKALEKQIDSHFLYNVLDSIKMMAETREVHDVADALLALGKMFRYNLQFHSKNVVLDEEITYLKSYIRLMNLRLDYEINVYVQIDSGLNNIKVPKMILQPVAENAIVHGLYGNETDTSIYLKISREEEIVAIEMTDMGKGISEERLGMIRVRIDGEDGEEGTGHIGLCNIHKRLRLIYGEGCGVKIYSKEGCYTKTVLLLKEDNAGI